MFALVFFMIINMGQLCDCKEPINPYSLAHQTGQFQAEDVVYINCNFCGASNSVEIIQTDEDGKPTIVRLPLKGDLEGEEKDISEEQTIEIILPRKVAQVKVPLPTPTGLTIGE